jgi:hypothetical protein
MQSKLSCISLVALCMDSLCGNRYNFSVMPVSIFGKCANIDWLQFGEWSSRDTSQKLTFFTRLSVGQSGYETTRKYKKVQKMTVYSCTSSRHLWRSQRSWSSLKYCTAIFNSALGVTCDLSAKLYLSVKLNVTCDQLKVWADHIFGSVLLPRREEILIFNHFVTSQGLWQTAM